MTKKENYEQKTEAWASEIAKPLGVSVYDVEYVKEGPGYILRVTLDKPDGVNIVDCENVSRALSKKLDEVDLIPTAYTLEVTSPGLGRALKKEKDYRRNINREIEIHLFKAKNKQKEFVGTLVSYTDETVTIQTGEGTLTIDKKEISRIFEYVDFGDE